MPRVKSGDIEVSHSDAFRGSTTDSNVGTGNSFESSRQFIKPKVPGTLEVSTKIVIESNHADAALHNPTTYRMFRQLGNGWPTFVDSAAVDLFTGAGRTRVMELRSRLSVTGTERFTHGIETLAATVDGDAAGRLGLQSTRMDAILHVAKKKEYTPPA